MAMVRRMLLLFLAVLPALATSGAHGDGNLTVLCHSDEAATLLQLKKSFLFSKATTSLPSWQDGTNCCRWEGVGCGGSTGRVTNLNLNGRGLISPGLDPVIFNLASLRFLDLSRNDFSGKSMISGFSGYSMPTVGLERLTFLSHLNLSKSGFEGEIPIAIGKLENLVSLDLSIDVEDDFLLINSSWISDFQGLVGNLRNLRELYLDGVDMSGSGEGWCDTLVKSTPRLQVLSLGECYLYGPIHQSLLNLSSLTVINLQSNSDIFAGRFPEFFMDFVNLTVLQVYDNNLEGWFPPRSFQSKRLRFLDLSGNTALSGSLPNFSDARSLHSLILYETNFSFSKPSSFSNFLSLQELALDAKYISAEFRSSLNMLPSLSVLSLSGFGFSGELESTFSWIGDLKNLAGLVLLECDLSSTKSSSISNFNNLRRLSIFTCNLTMPILSAVGNLMDLQSLVIYGCGLNGPMPSSIGNLTNLRTLDISYCDFLGPIPISIGNLVNLRSLSLDSSRFSGPMPSEMGNITNLRSLDIIDCGFPGRMPSTIGNLVNLRSMHLVYSDFYGPIPCAIGNLSRLQSMQLGCKLSGTIPYEVGQLKELTSLILGGNKFTGGIPNSVGNLTSLQYLDLSQNYLKGEIPVSLSNLPLQYLDLSQNKLSGPIKEFTVASLGLEYLFLSMNKLTGQIPRSILDLTNLRKLLIDWNNLVGLVELTSFWRLRKLIDLRLSHNKLSIVDGEGNNNSSTYFSGISSLQLGCCNITKFPTVLARVSNVRDLDLSCNRLSGDIPDWIWGRWNNSLSYLNLSHNMFTGMQLNSSFLPSSTLAFLDLSANRLEGQIPIPYSPLLFVDYSHNNFSSVLPNFTSYLGTTYLSMSNNSINGCMTDSVCSGIMGVFDLSYNNFSGPIPSCLIESGGLVV
ncbi:unnamed protein product [Triticum turgidum subsp. durum]|uniref:Leucine-rich repeat-containing N-terminal plant-type domain-containing protein n=1 Tax=Triticum turgidum subsp. durum TaxID=4567 RepID=A0A9R0R8Q5_TRITD|nr:unnamed protein product [Triticum turgidum subsp. durum]